MFALFFGLALLLVGIPLLIVGVVSRKRAKAALSWPTIQGEVTGSAVVQHTDNDSEYSSTSYEPVIEYIYSLMGQSYTGKRIAYGANSFNLKKAQEIAAKYPVGSPVVVHYNPEKPAECTLETSASGGKVFSIIGYILVPLGFILFIVGLFLS